MAIEMRKPIIGVMGGADATDAECREGRRLGELIAQRGWILLNGGRNSGIMAASAAGGRAAGGFVIGVLPDRDRSEAAPDLDVAIVTGLGDARNLINVLSSDVVIACRGRAGTLSEVALALKNDRPVILLNWEAGAALSEYSRAGRLHRVNSAEKAVELAGRLLPK